MYIIKLSNGKYYVSVGSSGTRNIELGTRFTYQSAIKYARELGGAVIKM